MSAIHGFAVSICLAALILPSARAFGEEAQAAADKIARPVEFIAHRGESYDAPENTLAALNLGFERDADAVETDVHLTADGKVVVIHDKDTLRVTGGKDNGGVKAVVAESKLEDLRKLDAGKWKGPAFAGEKLPTVEELLGTLPKDKKRRLMIEIKVGPEAVRPLLTAIEKAGRPIAQTAVISFNLDSCKAMKDAAPAMQVYYLADFKPDKTTSAPPPTIDELISRAKGAKLDGLDLSYKGPLDAASIKRIHDAGLKLYIWTLDDPEIAMRMIAYGVDGITTNRAQWLRQQVADGAPAAHPAAGR